MSGHALGNLLLTGLIDVAGNMSDGIESLSKVLNLKGKVLPLTEDNVVLMAEMIDGSIVEGEHNITEKNQKIKKIFYKETPKVLDEVICEIKRADLILLSMGSLFTSLLPNLICDEVKNAIDSSKGDVMYVCNMMTQPGETDNFKVSDHINVINSYLNKKKISYVIVNDGEITQKIKNKYLTEEQKDPVIYDKENLNNINVISDNFVKIENDLLRHNTAKLGFHIYSYFLKDE